MAEKKETDPMSMQRGDYTYNPRASLFFSLGRALTGPIQYYLITRHPLGTLFGVASPPMGFPPITLLGHTLPRLPFLIALMPGVLSAKHILWANFMMAERMTGQFAFFGVVADLMYESITSLVFTGAAINPLFSERYFNVGFAMYMGGVALELVAELQRMHFKSKPENKGKVCKSGFWGITRHINYTANVMFGFGYGLATGGPVYALMTGGMYVANFLTNAMPSIEAYCRGKYGREWEAYEREVPYQLFPGLY
ncbi:hypothetical protein P154DRAFT_576462 [Amniculicola lignicola CBS 123094]|uniref:Delta(14)-sterol reductase n=1 Tax=Amniculicola lignicola CBS 123094 TaxID=1392246 RepID=A0A6A5WIZ5_9PLEO|nr:hypothetical protein P154DRAFT_576462 [Amniculicola lignicola CBS 123094]